MNPAIRLFGLLVGCSLIGNCAKGQAITENDLQKAHQQWQRQGYPSYSLTMEIAGDTVKPGLFEIKVKDKKIINATRNGRNLATTDSFYTIEGLFAFLENELELIKEPERYFAAAPGARIYARAHFDHELGYPTRYLRAITDTKHNITVEIKKLEKLKN